MILNHPILNEKIQRRRNSFWKNPIMKNPVLKHQMFKTIQSHPCHPVDLQRILCSNRQNRPVGMLLWVEIVTIQLWTNPFFWKTHFLENPMLTNPFQNPFSNKILLEKSNSFKQKYWKQHFLKNVLTQKSNIEKSHFEKSNVEKSIFENPIFPKSMFRKSDL